VSRIVVAGLDIETTGLEQEKGHRIIEVAVKLYDLTSEALLAEWVQRVNPQRSIDPKAQAVHGITFEELSKEPTLEAIAPKLSRILSTINLVVAHNGRSFDLPFIRAELTRIGQTAPQPTLIDTCEDARWATPFGKLPNLAELCFATGVEYDPTKAHAADYDVDVMMKAFFAARRWGFFPTPETMKAGA
jgi:DNA polymerase-3 subunit epsilon